MTTTSRQDVVQKIVEASVEVRTQDDGAGRRRGDERRHPMVEPVRILKDDHRQSAGRPLTLGHDRRQSHSWPIQKITRLGASGECDQFRLVDRKN